MVHSAMKQAASQITTYAILKIRTIYHNIKSYDTGIAEVTIRFRISIPQSSMPADVRSSANIQQWA